MDNCVVWDFELCNCKNCVADISPYLPLPYPFPLFLTEMEGIDY